MLRLVYLVVALFLVQAATLGIRPVTPYLVPPVAKAFSPPNVSLVLLGCFTAGGSCKSGGWNGTTTSNPTITVTHGSTITFHLTSADALTHQFLIDTDGDFETDTADCPTVDPCSNAFSSAGTSFSFTVTFNAGSYTYLCTFHYASMHGTFVVLPSGTVGGTQFNTDKLGLIAPYAGLALAILGFIAVGLLYLRRRSAKGPE